jgi:predicted component of type VI protein secretion system
MRLPIFYIVRAHTNTHSHPLCGEHTAVDVVVTLLKSPTKNDASDYDRRRGDQQPPVSSIDDGRASVRSG